MVEKTLLEVVKNVNITNANNAFEINPVQSFMNLNSKLKIILVITVGSINVANV